MRQHIVSNEQLSQWAKMYSFDTMIKIVKGPPTLLISKRVHATTFEAYVGAAYLELGVASTQAWLSKLIDTLPHLQDNLLALGDLSETLIESNAQEKLGDRNYQLLLKPVSLLFIEASRRRVPMDWEELKESPEPNILWKMSVTCTLLLNIRAHLTNGVVVGNTFHGVAPNKQEARNKASLQALVGLGWGPEEEEPDSHDAG